MHGIEIKNKYGKVLISKNFETAKFHVTPQGIITPYLVSQTYQEALHFSHKINRPWNYIVNIDQVKFAHPSNIFILRKIKKLNHINKHIIISKNQYLESLANKVIQIVF